MRPLALLLCFLAGVACAQDVLNEDERLQFADGLYARGMHELAVKEYQTFLKDFPGTKKADVVHFRLGESYRSLGNRSAAEKEFKTVFSNYAGSPMRFNAGVRRADLFVDAGQFDAAIDLYTAVLKENPPEDVAATCTYLVGECQVKLGRATEAAQLFEQIRAKYPKSSFYPFALLKLGQIYADDPAKADQVLELYRAVADKPASERLGAEASFQMAELYFKRKDFAKSAEAYRKLMKDYPADHRASEARLQAAWASHNAGLYADALAVAVESLKNEAGDRRPEWLYLKANCERQLLKPEDALLTYGELLAKFPDSAYAAAARYERALSFYKQGKYKEAVDEAAKVKLTPEITKDVYWLLAESYAELKDEDNAIQYYRLIVKDFPKSDVACDATYRLAHHLQNKGEMKEASRYYAATAANYPERPLAPVALFASAACLARTNQLADAARDWGLMIQKYPAHELAPEAYYQKGLIETKQKKDGDALQTFGELVRLHPKSAFAADAHYWIGMLMKEAGKIKEAEESLRSALQASPRKEIEREAQFQLAFILQKNGKMDESAALFQSLLASPLQDKFSPPLLQWLAEFKSEKKAYKESLDAAYLLVQRSQEPGFLQAGWCLVGRNQQALGDNARAEESFRKALAAKTNTRFRGEAAFQLGDLTLAGKKYEDARSFYKLAAELAGDDSQLGVRARSYVGLARAAKGLGDLADASRYFMSVSVLYDDPELVPECLYEAARAFSLQGKADEAKKVVKELKERYPDSDWAKKPEIQIL